MRHVTVTYVITHDLWLEPGQGDPTTDSETFMEDLLWSAEEGEVTIEVHPNPPRRGPRPGVS